jgi:hypothetical protein
MLENEISQELMKKINEIQNQIFKANDLLKDLKKLIPVKKTKSYESKKTTKRSKYREEIKIALKGNCLNNKEIREMIVLNRGKYELSNRGEYELSNQSENELSNDVLMSEIKRIEKGVDKQLKILLDQKKITREKKIISNRYRRKLVFYYSPTILMNE